MSGRRDLKNGKCFVISPIGSEKSEIREHADNLFAGVIEPAMKRFGMRAWRADHNNEPGSITNQMWRDILQATCCIAVLTGENPNVYYELGLAQSLGKPVIIMMRADVRPPFDVHDFRYIGYDYGLKPLSVSETIKVLIRQLTSLKQIGWKSESLVHQVPKPPSLPISNLQMDVIRNDRRIIFFLRGIKETYMHHLRESDLPLIDVRLNLMVPVGKPRENGVRLRIATADYIQGYGELETQEKWDPGEGKCGVAWATGIQQIFATDVRTKRTRFAQMNVKDKRIYQIKSVLSTPLLLNRKPVAVLNMDSRRDGMETLVNKLAVQDILANDN